MVPWRVGHPLEPSQYEAVWLKATFECHKWDAYVGDSDTLAPFPLILRATAWREVAELAEALTQEVFAAEQELLSRPDLHPFLKLAPPIRRVFKDPPQHHWTPGIARVIRIDFHWTDQGWRISEANTDVPGAFNEAGGFTSLMAAYYPDAKPVGDPAVAMAQAMSQTVGVGARIPLVHATAYSDDRQVMEYLADRMREQGLEPCLIAPDQLSWPQGQALIKTDWICQPADALYRFFPAEWLPNLPQGSGWSHFFKDSHLPHCNPATALLTQGKRFPLVWEHLKTPLSTWRKLLPETRDPRQLTQDDDRQDWVAKPVWGREGEDIIMSGILSDQQWQQTWNRIRRSPDDWVVQQRFQTLPIATPLGSCYPCLGVYTVAGSAVGAFVRLSKTPVIDGLAWNTAVLVADK
ncbi:MAG: glutathionylspermidine synthase family protein [Cyanophyceae cyanobacterium]